MAAALAAGAHVLLGLLLLVELRFTPREVVDDSPLVGMAITLLPLVPPTAVEPLRDRLEPASVDTFRPRAITLAPASAPEMASTETTRLPAADADDTDRAPRGIDWRGQAAGMAGRFGQPEAATTFSPPPEALRAPCERRNYRNGTSSFKWKADNTSKGGSAGLTLGWEPPPVYDGLFDDMKAGKTPDSSVPDEKECD